MVRCVSAGQRLDRTEFRSEVEWLDHVVQVAGYRCPHCAAEVEFLRRHFEAAARIAIDSRWRTAFDAARALRVRERGLDFLCPGCAAPARIVYAQMSGDDYKTSDWDLLEVLEAGEWPEPIQT
jgi:predicted RNA-binding Zn-ribbon protein involved in translation (DUF1610 family)